jgi:hypothetical protein
MQRFTWTVAALALLGGGAGSARADHLYNTFGPGDSFNSSSAVSIEGNSFLTIYSANAMEFSPSETATLDVVRFAMSAVYPGPFEAVLAADNGGQPGTTLEDLGSVSVTGPATIYSLSSGLHPLLTAGTEYWLILQPTNPNSQTLAFWHMSSPLVTAPAAATNDPAHGSWRAYSGQTAFDIEGTATATPEPASLTLLGVSAVCLLGYGWRQRRRPGLPAAAA